MKRNENIYDLLNGILELDEDSISLLEAQVDSDIQLEYFECAKKNQVGVFLSESDIISNKEKILDPSVSIDQKKVILIRLASMDNVEAYRAIETYIKKPNIKLLDWASIALQESRLLLESKLLEANKVLITTGLGGEGDKLRYFIVFLTKDGSPLTSLQQRIIKSELSYASENQGAEIEDIVISENFAQILSMVPLRVPVKSLFDNVLKECNEFGNFLFNDYIITNVKIFSIDEINELLAINNTF